MMLASPIGTGIEREHNVQTTHDYAINLNDPIIEKSKKLHVGLSKVYGARNQGRTTNRSQNRSTG